MRPDSPQKTLLILGASGDLTARLLLPGLGGLLAIDEVNDLSLVGSGTDDWDDNRWRAKPFGTDAGSAAALNDLLAQLVPEPMSTGSTISWACRPCSTSWGCASPTA
jgi:glucose-6-phosphate 1-dehydrogenase